MNIVASLLQSSLYQHRKLELSSGLSLLNYALSGNMSGAVELGSIVFVVGASGSGRTTFGLTFLAEASVNSFFDDYDLVYLETEGKTVDIGQFLGISVERRVRVEHPTSLEALWDSLSAQGRSQVVYVDSLDGLLSENDWQINNRRAKEVFDLIRRKKSIVIFASQEKHIGCKKVTAGGFAIPFYADYVVRLTNNGDIIRSVNGADRCVGSNISASVLKARYGLSKLPFVPAPVFVGSGYDNAESLMMFLRYRQKVVENGGRFHYPDFDWHGTYNQFVKKIAENEILISSVVEQII